MVFYNAHGDLTAFQTPGGVVRRYIYDAFGNQLNSSSGDMNLFRYCGEYWDKETETYYLRARYYDPRIGRFLCQDPIQAGLNWYTYCASNPVMYIDPWGLVAVMLDYIADYDKADFYYKINKDMVEITIDGMTKSCEYEKIENGVILIESDWLVDNFGIERTLVEHQEGDRFRSADDAALAFTLMYNPLSFDTSNPRYPTGREYGANIYENEGRYSFWQVVKGSGTSVKLSKANKDYGTLSAQIHTHGAGVKGMEDGFSRTDLNKATVNQYVATPGGNLIRSEFIKQKGWWIFKRSIFDTAYIISSSVPKDARDWIVK